MEEEPMSVEESATHDGPRADLSGTSSLLTSQHSYPSANQDESDASLCNEKPHAYGTGHLGHLKRHVEEKTPESSGIENIKRIKLDSEEDDSKSPAIDSSFSKDNRYHKGGLVHSLHGNIYQLKLQMLFLKRALNKDYEFNLGTEVEDAEKFDDVVFKYKRKNELSECIRFVQVKHRQNESKRITVNDLMKGAGMNDEFSLQKYFISYCKIKKKLAFKEKELKDFILYTNIDFDFANLEKAGVETKTIEEGDDILVVNKHSGRHKFNIPKDHKLYEKLRETSNLYLLAKELAQHVLSKDKRKIELRSDVMKRYHGPLSRKVLKIEEKRETNEAGKEVIKKHAKFRVEFVNDDKLPTEVSNFRTALKSALKMDKKDDAFRQKLNDIEFGDEFELQSNPTIDKPSQLRKYKYKIENFKNDKIEDCEIDNFFEKLVFAVNQPNEVKLGKIIKDEIGELSQFNLLNADLVADSFQREMLDWFKAKGNEKGKEGVFLNKKDGQEFFDSIEQKVNSLISIGLSLAYSEKLKSYGIKFDKNDIFRDLKSFLSRENTSTKIFHLNSQEETILKAIKVYDTLEDLKQQEGFTDYQKHDSYIFMCLRKLLPTETQKRVLDSFKSPVSNNLLIIHCESTSTEQEILEMEDLSAKLSDNLSKTYKKIILITKKDNERHNKIVEQFSNELMYKFKDGASFNDFTITEGSKKNLLEKKITAFQGEKIHLMLKQLYFKLDYNELLSPKQLNQLNIDTKTLYQLITNEEIEVGERLRGKSDLESSYSKFYEDVDTDVLITRLVESDDRFFIISGINGSKKRDSLIENLKTNTKKQVLDISQKLMCEFEVIRGEGIKKITLADSKFKEEHFKQLCHDHPDKNFYWINWRNNKFILHSLYYPEFLERRFKYPEKITICGDVKTELFNSRDNNVSFFISGVGNLEELHQVLWLEKENEQEKLKENYELGNIIIAGGDKKDIHKFNETTREIKTKTDKPVYWLAVESEEDRKQIIWNDVTRKTVLEKDLIRDIKDKSSIIIDKPGMGKSTSLTLLSKKMLESHWVILITLRDWQEIIGHLPEEINNDAVIEFLSNTNNLNTHLERSIVKHILDETHEGGGVKPLLLLFDGFDEIRSYDAENIGQKKVEGLLRFLKEKTQSTIWITAREHDANRLKNTLSVFDIKFESLDDAKQTQYFENCWRNSLALSHGKNELDEYFSGGNSKFKMYYTKLSNVANKILTDQNNSFMGIPLTLRLFAESFRDKFKRFVDSNNADIGKDFDNLSILKLYEYFIDEKFKIFFREKTNLSSSFTVTSEDWFKATLIKLHNRLAFKELYGEDETKKLLGVKKPFRYEGTCVCVDSEQLTELLNVGIIRSIKKGDYEFLHRTLAEYFVAGMFRDMLLSKRENNEQKYRKIHMFLKENVLKVRSKVIHQFLDAMSNENEAIRVVWLSIVGEESSNILGQAANTYRFTINTRQNEKIEDLMETVKSFVKWEGGKEESFRYEEDGRSWNGTIIKLVNKCLIETNCDQLKTTLEYLIKLFNKTIFGKFRGVLSERAILDILGHYIVLLSKEQNQNKLGPETLDFIKRIFKIIGRDWQKMMENYEDYSKEFNIAFSRAKEEYKRYYQDGTPNKFNDLFSKRISDGWLKDTEKAIRLTHEISVMCQVLLDWRNKAIGFNCKSNIFENIIVPLLSVKYDPSLFTQTDTCALVNLFQAAAAAELHRDLTLPQTSLEGLIECIRYLVHPDNISILSFTVSVYSLIALKHWNFKLAYLCNSLFLQHNTEEYRCLLKLPCEVRIVNLIKMELGRGSPQFKEECANIVRDIKTRK